eukprot:CAMPEP_0198687224 /NCGR_PEP_ID=MMETSP1468-20131203/47156_1 /TAXON_ID=1461545 /ORGANISM="Mantoniella sp, Strain CCMP1436" /LENGTH=36 /DNA_ID= /DNA_START= /DNA_END= /DNA_ORIENTATION=
MPSEFVDLKDGWRARRGVSAVRDVTPRPLHHGAGPA